MLHVDYKDLQENPSLLLEENAVSKTKAFHIDYTGDDMGRVIIGAGQCKANMIIKTNATRVTVEDTNCSELIAPNALYIQIGGAGTLDTVVNASLKSITAPELKSLILYRTRELRDVSFDNLLILNARYAHIHNVNAPQLQGGYINACPYLNAERNSLYILNNLIFSPFIQANKEDTNTAAFYNINKQCYAHDKARNQTDPEEFFTLATKDFIREKDKPLRLFIDQVEMLKETTKGFTQNVPQGNYRPEQLEMVA